MPPIIILITIFILTGLTRAQQNVGSSCRLPHNGEYGACTYLNYCPVAQQLHSSGLQVHICSQFNGAYIVCCPIQRNIWQSQWQPQWQPEPFPSYQQAHPAQTTTTTTVRPKPSRISTRSPRLGWPQPSTEATDIHPIRLKTTRISEKKCKEFKSSGVEKLSASTLSLWSTAQNLSNDDCDFADGLITGGKEAKTNEFPHMAAIGWRLRSGDVVFKCGGSLISERFVLTVAHCSFDIQTGLPPSFVRLGQKKLDGSTGVDINIDEFMKHESYSSLSSYFDIALIRLSRNVTFTNAIRPACLWQTQVLPHSKAIATGWGALKTYGSTSETLMKVELDIKDNEECSRKLEDDHRLSNGMTSDFICAGSDKGKDTCEGDSGGPIQVVNTGAKCQFHIIGVTSFAPPLCGGRGAVAGYTRVSHYLDWIENKVW